MTDEKPMAKRIFRCEACDMPTTSGEVWVTVLSGGKPIQSRRCLACAAEREKRQ